MPIVSSIVFAQGANTGAAGIAQGVPPASWLGVVSSAVTVSNGNNVGVVKWGFTMFAVPPASALPTGIPQLGTTPTWTFTPDVPGGYLVQLDVYDAIGNVVSSQLCFGVVETISGRFIPPFNGTNLSLNFGGQAIGWALYQDAWLKYQDSFDKPVRFDGSGPLGGATPTLTSILQRICYTNTTGGTLASITFPSVANAVDGQYVEFYDEYGQWPTHNLEILANSTQQIVQQSPSSGVVSGSFVLTGYGIPYTSIAWRYSGPQKLWIPA